MAEHTQEYSSWTNLRLDHPAASEQLQSEDPSAMPVSGAAEPEPQSTAESSVETEKVPADTLVVNCTVKSPRESEADEWVELSANDMALGTEPVASTSPDEGVAVPADDAAADVADASAEVSDSAASDRDDWHGSESAERDVMEEAEEEVEDVEEEFEEEEEALPEAVDSEPPATQSSFVNVSVPGSQAVLHEPEAVAPVGETVSVEARRAVVEEGEEDLLPPPERLRVDRHCSCLGGPYGFHREDCQLASNTAADVGAALQ